MFKIVKADWKWAEKNLERTCKEAFNAAYVELLSLPEKCVRRQLSVLASAAGVLDSRDAGAAGRSICTSAAAAAGPRGALETSQPLPARPRVCTLLSSSAAAAAPHACETPPAASAFFTVPLIRAVRAPARSRTGARHGVCALRQA
jgi:hypothetical protein